MGEGRAEAGEVTHDPVIYCRSHLHGGRENIKEAEANSC